MIEGVTIGFYAGVGLCAGLAFYFTDDPFTADDPRSIRILQALVVAVAWIIVLFGIIVPEILQTYLHNRGEGE